MVPFLVIILLVLLVSAPLALVLVWILRRDVMKLHVRNNELEARIQKLEGSASAQAGAQGEEAGAAPEGAPAPPRETVPVHTRLASTLASHLPTEPRPAGTPAGHLDLEALVGGQWLTWLGILAIFFGTAFFLAYDLGESAFAGMGQVLTGLVVAVVFIAVGRTQARGARAFLARGLLGGGVGLLYVSAYASHAFHNLVPPHVVYPFLLGAAVIGALVALGEDSLMVATLTQAGAVLTPILLARGGYPAAVLFPYLVAVNVGTILVSSRRRWPLLPLSGFIGTSILTAWWWFTGRPHASPLASLLGVGSLWALYAVFPFVSRAAGKTLGVARAFVILTNALLFELFLYNLLRSPSPFSGHDDIGTDLSAFRGAMTAALALAYVAGSRIAERRGPATPGTRMNHYAGLALAVLAVPIQFDLAWVTLSWSLLGAILLWSGVNSRDLGDRLLAFGVFVLAIARVMFFDSFHTMENVEEYRPLVNGDFLVGAATALVLGWAAWVLSRRREHLSGFERRLVTPLILTAVTLFLWRLSFENMAWFASRELRLGQDFNLAALLTLSLIWAVYAGLLILAGFVFRFRPVRVLGMAVLGILIAKVFLFDMQELERGYRIASFVGVGLLLLLISILYQKERRA